MRHGFRQEDSLPAFPAMSTVALRIDPVPGRPPEGIMGCVVGDTVGNGSCQIPRAPVSMRRIPANLRPELAYTTPNSRLLEQERRDIEVSGSGTHHRSGQRKGRVRGKIHDRHARGYGAGAARQTVGGLDLDLRQRSFGRYIENRQNTIAKRRLDLPLSDPDGASAHRPRDAVREGENIYDRRLSAAVAEHEARCDLIVIDCPGQPHTAVAGGAQPRRHR